MGLDLYLLCSLPGRYSDGLLAGDGCGHSDLGKNLRKVAPAGILGNPAFFPAAFPDSPVSLEKNFGKCKNFVCICGKMGYNRMYENL